MKPSMENANNAIELYSNESTWRFCITLTCQGQQFRGTKSLLQGRPHPHGTFVGEKRFMVGSWVLSVSSCRPRLNPRAQQICTIDPSSHRPLLRCNAGMALVVSWRNQAFALRAGSQVRSSQQLKTR